MVLESHDHGPITMNIVRLITTSATDLNATILVIMNEILEIMAGLHFRRNLESFADFLEQDLWHNSNSDRQ